MRPKTQKSTMALPPRRLPPCRLPVISPAQLLVCDGRCDRKNRPLACRLFPLFLKFREDQTPVLRMDARARAVCPLTDYGMKALDPEFKQAARRAYDLLLEDKVCAAYLRALDEAFTL